MLFTSPIFLFLFLPITLLLYFLTPRAGRNTLLLLASLFFYAWGDGLNLLLLLASIGLNYGFARALDDSQRTVPQKSVLAFALAVNLLFLGYFKYAEWLAREVNSLLVHFGLSPFFMKEPALPLGVSFFTFQAISYLIDVYRKDTPVEKNPFTVALYIALFPQLLAGPIIRYRQIAHELRKRRENLALASEGCWRFSIGLAKKVLLADNLAPLVTNTFNLPASQITAGQAWLVAVCFAFQLYFDFSGYSDMAIGIGKILGFNFPENFNYPYTSRSVSEFWTRWHMSLTSWFRTYLFFPLTQKNTTDKSRGRWAILFVFTVVGIWHGANWNFVFFGVLHGMLVLAETTALGDWLRKAPKIAGLVYCATATVMTLVLFRASSLDHGLDFWKSMIGYGSQLSVHDIRLDLRLASLLLICTVSSTALIRNIDQQLNFSRGRAWWAALKLTFLAAVLLACAMEIAGGTFKAFIYYRF